MVRYYGGIKLGPLRFQLMQKTVESAITGWQVVQRSVPPEDDPWKEGLQLDPPRQWGEESENKDSD